MGREEGKSRDSQIWIGHGRGEQRDLSVGPLVAKHRRYARGTGYVYRVHPYPWSRRVAVARWTLYEVFKRVLQQRQEGDALRAVAVMQQGSVVDLDARLALSAARVSVETRMPMADSIVLATARLHDATLWTQDAHFEGRPGVRYRARRA